MTSASNITRLSRKIQDFLTTSASFSWRPYGLKKVRVEIIFKNQILLESLKNISEFCDAILCCFEPFDWTRFGRQRAPNFFRGHGSPSFKRKLCDTSNLLGNTIVSNVIPKRADLLNPRDRGTFHSKSRNRPCFGQRVAHKHFGVYHTIIITRNPHNGMGNY